MFALLPEGSGKKNIAILSTILAFVAASLSAMQTFFNFHKTAEGHSSVGNRYLNISRNCKKLLHKHQDLPFTPENYREKLRQPKMNIEAEAFPTSERYFKSAQKAHEVTLFILNSNTEVK